MCHRFSIFNQQPQSLFLINVFDSKITSSIFDNVRLDIKYNSPPVCYNELHHYSLTLTNVTVTNGYLVFGMFHGISYNVSVIIDNVIMSALTDGTTYTFTESLSSLYITNSSASNSRNGFLSFYDAYSQQSINCNIKGVESQSTIVIEDSQFHNNDTELVGNRRNEIRWSLSVLLNSITVTNSLSTGLVIVASVVTVENRLVFKNNTGVVGGGMAINDSYVVALSPSTILEFIDNHATYKGGGIYIDNITEIDFFLMFQTIKTLNASIFKDNTAEIAGNDIYGKGYGFKLSILSRLKIFSTLSAFTFCDPDSNETTPIWYDDDEQQSVFPGQPLKYNVALFGRTFDTNSYSFTDGRITIEINGTLVIDKYINNCSLIEYTPNYINHFGEHNITLIVTTDTSFSTELSIPFILNECPIGFS
uniref:Right handed beta helix domain-containing protein n=1 Tax=Amphimedon queenslandica TaxID=400682 RepID=A0A1X7T723_AMPQE